MASEDTGRKHHLQCDANFPNYGLYIQTIEHSNNNREQQIVSIVPYSQADIQGLRIGDTINKINNHIVQNMNETDVNNLIRSSASSKMNLVLEIKDRQNIGQSPLVNTSINRLNSCPLQTTTQSVDDNHPSGLGFSSLNIKPKQTSKSKKVHERNECMLFVRLNYFLSFIGEPCLRTSEGVCEEVVDDRTNKSQSNIHGGNNKHRSKHEEDNRDPDRVKSYF